MAITLRAARVNKGLNLKDAANQLGINESTLHNYERGKTFPDVKMVVKIQELYGLNYDQIQFLPSDAV